MADKLTDNMHRERNLINSDAHNINRGVSPRRTLHPAHVLTRKTSDHSNSQHQYQQPMQSLPMITTTDYSDPSSLTAMRLSKALFNRANLDAGYDTDGGIGTSRSSPKRPQKSSNGYEHLVSPRLSTRRAHAQSSKQLPVVPLQQRSSLHAHLAINSRASSPQNPDEPIYDGDARRHHIRLSRRIHHPTAAAENHNVHGAHSPALAHPDVPLANTSSGRPFRLVFMRHSERANQALGSDWFHKAFRTGTYQAYDQNLPIALPKRYFDQAYEFDAPLTVRGLKNARNTGRAMLSTNLVADVCLSSTALRCIQTCERILKGMDLSDRIAIRVEPGLFECPHLNHYIVDSFMTKKELVENGYNIKLEYKPLVQKVETPESLDEYFNRCVTVMRGIIDRYGHHGGTVLIVTHAPGILALTDAIKGLRPKHDTFYRAVAAYPPLAIYVSEYDGTKWKHSEQPFAITPAGQ